MKCKKNTRNKTQFFGYQPCQISGVFLGILLALAWQKKTSKPPKHRSIGPLFRPELGVIKASFRLASVPKSPIFVGDKSPEILRGTCGQGKPQHVICICDTMWPWFLPPVFSLIFSLWKWLAISMLFLLALKEGLSSQSRLNFFELFCFPFEVAGFFSGTLLHSNPRCLLEPKEMLTHFNHSEWNDGLW